MSLYYDFMGVCLCLIILQPLNIFPFFYLSVSQSIPTVSQVYFQWFTDEWGVGVQYEEFTKSLIFRGFDDVLKNPFRYVHLFQLLTLLSKENIENRHA